MDDDNNYIRTRISVLDAAMAVDAAGNVAVAWLDNGKAWQARHPQFFPSDYDLHLRTATIPTTTAPQITKHYYAPSSGSGQGNGQRIATRVDDALYYALNEPTGLGTLFVNDTGTEAGHIIYDAMGSVVKISPELPEALVSHLDPTGLQWDGLRYYDPLAGMYTQPNPFGGVPEAPQSLNPFSAASSGSTGLVLAQSGGGGIPPLAVDVGKSILLNSTSASISKKILDPAFAGLVNRSAWHWLNIEATAGSRTGIRAPLKRLLGENGGSVSIARRLSSGRLDQWTGLVRLGSDYPEWAGRLGRRGVSLEARSLARGVWNFGPKFLKVADIVPGLGADLLVGGVWQLGVDLFTHPELLADDPGLLGRRVAAGSLSNATIGAAGMAIAGTVALGLGVFGISVSAPVVVVGGAVFGGIIAIGWGEEVDKWWFEKLNAKAPWEQGGE